MRCFFIRGGHIVAAEELTELSDEEAIAATQVLFSEWKNLYHGFEMRDRARMLMGHPHLIALARCWRSKWLMNRLIEWARRLLEGLSIALKPHSPAPEDPALLPN
jgi:hypothetical protein